MSNMGALVLDLELNGSQFTVSLRQATGALGAFVTGAQNCNTTIQRTEAGFRSFGRMLRDTVLTLALARDAFRNVADATVGWQKKILDVNGEMQRSIQLMKSFSKETDPIKATAEAMNDVNMLLEKASNAPFSLKAITDSFVKLRVSGIRPIEQGFNALVDSVAQFGGNDEALKRASVAIQQMAGKGVISMEELRQQLGEAVPTAIQQMADGLGVTYSKLVKEISQGKVKSEPAIIAMFREMELQSKGSAEAMMNTWQGATAQLNTEFTKILLTIGGFQEGYGDGTYMNAMTKGIRELTLILKDPATMSSAKAFGTGLTEIMNSAMNGLKWIIQYRSEIYELGKALVTIYAATKAVSIIRALGAAFVSLAASMTGAAGGVRTSWAAMTAGLSQFGNGVASMRNASNAASGAMTAMRGVLSAVGGAAAIVTGPIGMLTAAVAAGAYSWWEYKKAAQAGIQAMIDAKGQGAGLADLMKAQEQVIKNNADIASLKSDIKISENPDGVLDKITASFINTVGKKKEIAKLEQQNSQLNDSIIQAQANVITSKATVEFEAAKGAIADGMAVVNKQYRESLKDWQQNLIDGDKSGKSKDESFMTASATKKFELEKTRMQAEYELYSKQIDEIQKQIDSKTESTKDGKIIGLDEAGVASKVKAANELRDALGRVGDQQVALIQSSKTFADTKLDGAGAKQQKVAFDMLTIFVDGMRKKLGTLDAKIEETNPYIAQLEATVESLGGVHLPNFDKMVADGRRMAEEIFVQEKARKALTDANTLYKESMERIRQIETTAKNKLNKAEEDNPWEKASADAVRYEEELQDLIEKMEEARQKAADAQVKGGGKGLLQKLQEDAVAASAAVEETRQILEKLKVSDTAKKMAEDSRAINDSLMTNSDRTKAQYDRQTAYADEFYAKHKEQINSDAESLAAYSEYRLSLDNQYQRDTESGLDEWIRTNKDATDQYKALWGSAMDKFTDTITTGLTTGKLEFGDFVTYVLEEIVRIQVAKAVAAAAEAASSGTSGWLGIVGSIAGSYFGGTGANGFASGSAAATSSSLGASSAGYSSTYFEKGGIMTEYGQLALNKYANGGIAKSPQVAIYGEGKTPEAYVPLPDGRTIPVTMSDTGSSDSTGGDSNVVININVTGSGETSDSTGNEAEQWKSMANRVKAVAREEIAAQKRPGGMLYQ